MKSQKHIKLINELSKDDYGQLTTKKIILLVICVMYKWKILNNFFFLILNFKQNFKKF